MYGPESTSKGNLKSSHTFDVMDVALGHADLSVALYQSCLASCDAPGPCIELVVSCDATGLEIIWW